MAFNAHYLPAIKVCGITNISDALLAAKLGARYLGYVLNYSASPRRLTAAECMNIITAVRASYPKVQQVGVTVDLQPATVNELVRRLRLDVVQLHGAESIATVQAIRAPQIWKSVILNEPAAVAQLVEYAPYVQALHLDAGRGSGKIIAADLLPAAVTALAKLGSAAMPLVIAGGITPNNIDQFLQYQAAVLDVNSGVEAQPGKKDPQLLQKLFQTIYAYAWSIIFQN